MDIVMRWQTTTSRHTSALWWRFDGSLEDENLGESLKRIAWSDTFSTGNTMLKPASFMECHSNRSWSFENNGIRLEGQQIGAQEHAPEIDPFLQMKSLVIKGAKPFRYAWGNGSVILVNPSPTFSPKKQPSKQKTGFYWVVRNSANG